MEKFENPIYESQRTLKNFWQKYSIFPDRIELGCCFWFKNIEIPMASITKIEICSFFVVGNLYRGKGLGAAFAVKLDFADFCKNIHIERKNGFFKHFCFVPDSVEDFMASIPNNAHKGRS